MEQAKRVFFRILVISIVVLMPGLRADLQNIKSPPLIPLLVLPFDRPTYANLQLSPDGMWLAYIVTGDSKKIRSTKVWKSDFKALCVKNLSKQDQPDITLVACNKKTAIDDYCWAPDSKQILYIKNTKGQQKLYTVDVLSGAHKCYTPKPIHFKSFFSQPHILDTLFLSFANKKGAFPDLYKLTLSTQKLEIAIENNEKIINFILDHNLNVRAALCFDYPSIQLLSRVEGTWIPVLTKIKPKNGDMRFTTFSFTEDNTSLYFMEKIDSNAQVLKKINLTTKNIETVAEDAGCDCTDVYINNKGKLQAVAFQRVKEEWVLYDKDFGEHFTALESMGSGQRKILGTDRSGRKFLVKCVSDTNPGTYYLYDAHLKKTHFLFDAYPFLNDYTFASVEPMSFKARDGLLLHGYLTLPVGMQRKKVPLILHVHGGPSQRDVWQFNLINQFLANRGYAVLQVNYRGSEGYGKSFQEAGYKEWGRKMQYDLIDAVQWAINQEIADPKKIAIMGNSYGGYAALIGATDTPDLFCCAVAGHGPSSLVSYVSWCLTQGIETKEYMAEKIGNPDDALFLKERSPLFKIDSIKLPLLIVHGARDTKVSIDQSEELVKALQTQGKYYRYLRFEDEEHGMSHPNNRVTYLSALENFFATHLGGRCTKSTTDELKSRKSSA